MGRDQLDDKNCISSPGIGSIGGVQFSAQLDSITHIILMLPTKHLIPITRWGVIKLTAVDNESVNLNGSS